MKCCRPCGTLRRTFRQASATRSSTIPRSSSASRSMRSSQRSSWRSCSSSAWCSCSCKAGARRSSRSSPSRYRSIGTFTVLYALGISFNNLSLFGLVLAVGIVVDDAIVVVENVERNLRSGMSPPEAAHKTMDEVGGALISIALTLCAVFVPSAFLSGHLRPVLSPVRGHDRRLDDHLLLRLADAEPGSVRRAFQAARPRSVVSRAGFRAASCSRVSTASIAASSGCPTATGD